MKEIKVGLKGYVVVRELQGISLLNGSISIQCKAEIWKDMERILRSILFHDFAFGDLL